MEKKNLDTLDFMALYQMGNAIKIIFEDGTGKLAESVDEISFFDGLATFEVVEN